MPQPVEPALHVNLHNKPGNSHEIKANECQNRTEEKLERISEAKSSDSYFGSEGKQRDWCKENAKAAHNNNYSVVSRSDTSTHCERCLRENIRSGKTARQATAQIGNADNLYGVRISFEAKYTSTLSS